MEKDVINMNLSAPNLLNICIDKTEHGEVCGRLYHYYKEEPTGFSNIVELMNLAERLFDGIAFPQASTKSRCFRGEKQDVYNAEIPKKVVEQAILTAHRGEKATLVTSVCFRQNSTWQGEALWMEQGEKKQFRNELELIRIIEQTLA